MRKRICLSPNWKDPKHRWFEQWYSSLPGNRRTDAVINACYEHEHGIHMVAMPINQATLTPVNAPAAALPETQLQPVNSTSCEADADDAGLLDDWFG